MNIHIVLKTLTFGRYIYEGNITFEEASEYQTDLLAEIMNFRKNMKPQSRENKTRKKNCSQKLV